MDQHPVPQNITGFQFKLIGDMTLKQFAYLAGGILIGYACTLFSWPAIFKWPLAFFFGFLGFAIAFMPFEERSLDKWIVSFFKAVYSPTQYIWKKEPPPLEWFLTSDLKYAPPSPSPKPSPPKSKLKEFLSTLPSPPESLLDEKELIFIKKLDFSLGQNLLPVVNPPSEEIEIPSVKVRKLKTPPLSGEIFFPPSPHTSTSFSNPQNSTPTSLIYPPEEKVENEKPSSQFSFSSVIFGTKKDPPKIPLPSTTVISPVSSSKKSPADTSSLAQDLEKQNAQLSSQIESFQKEIENLKQIAIDTEEGKIRLDELISKYQEAKKEREKALNELALLKRKFEQKEKQAVLLVSQTPAPSPRVHFVQPKTSQKTNSINVNLIPNVITGSVTDKNGVVLPDVILIVKDLNDNPVRAMKTNKVGQFKTITPLANGKYLIELEKEGFEFDIIEIEAKGSLIPPLEIKAK